MALALFDEELCDSTRAFLATSLWRTPRPSSFSLGKPKFPPLQDQLPILPSLIGPRSWLLFSLLGLDGPQEWLQIPVGYWNKFAEYRSARDYLKRLEVTNDSAERGVKLISDFNDMALDEEQ